jgi:hypothetical protein
VRELGADEPAERGRRPADRDRCVGRRRREPLEDAARVTADGLELGDRRRVRAQIGVGEKAGPDPKRLAPLDTAAGVADRDLARATADVDDGDRPLELDRHRPRRADEGEARLLVPGEDAKRKLARLLDRGRQRIGVVCLANRGGRDGDDLERADLARDPRLGGDDLGGLLDLLRRDLAATAQGASDPGEGALADELAQAPVGGVGHQQPRRVAADVDAAVDQAPGGSFAEARRRR